VTRGRPCRRGRRQPAAVAASGGGTDGLICWKCDNPAAAQHRVVACPTGAAGSQFDIEPRAPRAL